MGAMAWGNSAADPLSSDRTRHPIKGQRSERYCDGDLADCGFYCRGTYDRGKKIQANIGLDTTQFVGLASSESGCRQRVQCPDDRSARMDVSLLRSLDILV